MSRQAVPLRIWHLQAELRTWELALVDFSEIRYVIKDRRFTGGTFADPALEVVSGVPSPIQLDYLVTLGGGFLVPPTTEAWAEIARQALLLANRKDDISAAIDVLQYDTRDSIYGSFSDKAQWELVRRSS